MADIVIGLRNGMLLRLDVKDPAEFIRRAEEAHQGVPATTPGVWHVRQASNATWQEDGALIRLADVEFVVPGRALMEVRRA